MLSQLNMEIKSAVMQYFIISQASEQAYHLTYSAD